MSLIDDTPQDTQLAHYEQFVDDNWTGGSPEYTMIALAGEVGEVCNEHKKVMRLQNPATVSAPEKIREHKKNKLEELGDALYYLVRACHDEGVSLRLVMLDNEKKLRKRHGTAGTATQASSR